MKSFRTVLLSVPMRLRLGPRVAFGSIASAVAGWLNRYPRTHNRLPGVVRTHKATHELAVLKGELVPIAERLSAELEANATDWSRVAECVAQLHSHLTKRTRLLRLRRGRR